MMINNCLYIFLGNFILSLFFLYNKNIISRSINLYDSPDKLRKFHKKRVPLIGGLLFLINFVLFLFLANYEFFDFSSFRGIVVVLIISFLFFFVGLIDDKKNINPNSKFILFSFLILLSVLSNDSFVLKNLNFLMLDRNIQLNNLSIFFTIICILLFVNAFNMFDGINGQSGIYLLVIFTFFITNNIFVCLSFALIIVSCFFVYGNLKNYFFLGNSGTYFVSFFISIVIIHSYNIGKILFVEEIFILMMVPGYDLLRVAIVRVYNSKHPFYPDRNHLHHLINNNFSLVISNLLLLIIIIFPILLAELTNNYILAIIIGTLFYFFIIFWLKKTKKTYT
jgi:UDP-GlcNAc:undecaprenyl-phosphate GlcNAc-1-phosphate transferase